MKWNDHKGIVKNWMNLSLRLGVHKIIEQNDHKRMEMIRINLSKRNECKK